MDASVGRPVDDALFVQPPGRHDTDVTTRASARCPQRLHGRRTVAERLITGAAGVTAELWPVNRTGGRGDQRSREQRRVEEMGPTPVKLDTYGGA